ncbi:hypothetical protein BDV12DRAFT_167065 [Aspergillus spectabilis]
MDNLLPLSSPHHHLEIPLFGNEVYDNLEFFTYPERRDWDPRRHSLTGNYHPRSSIHAASFIQAWLFFGTISEVTGVPVRGTNFLRVSKSDEQQRLVITTERLQFYLDTWRASATSVTKDERQKREFRDNVKILLDFVIRFTVPTFLVPEHPEVAVSIDLLLVVLVDAFKDIYGLEMWNVPSRFASDVQDEDLSPGANQGVIKYLKTRMVAQGWCPYRVVSFGDSALSDTLYTLSLMGTRDLLSGHEGCDEDGCVGNYVDDAMYNETPRHVRQGCECGFVRTDVEKLSSIIEEGQIPIAKVVVDSETKQVRLETTPHEPGITYIAISHVWAHGLGNPDENALRSCQLLELDRLVKCALEDQDLGGGDTKAVYFWIDTLCLPLQPPHSRKTGIKQMRHCYEDATAVLVLDKHLRRSTAYNPSVSTEALLQVAICDWRFRVWTLQEGIFAQNLIFQFLDTSVSADELMFAHFSSSSSGPIPNPSLSSTSEAEMFPNLAIFLVFNLFPALGVDMGRSKQERGPSLREVHFSLLSLLLSLQGRAISKPEDEPICSASLLGQDHVLSAVLECRKEERMKVFWRAQGRVPAWVPFIDGPKIEESGLRWAPSTLRYKAQLLGGVSGGPASGDLAYIESGGLWLRITKPGFVGFELEDNDGALMGVGLTTEGHAFRIRDDRGYRYDVVRSKDRYNGELPELGKDIAVIVSEWLETYSPQVLIVAVKPHNRDQGEESDTIHCRILCSGIIIVHDTFPRDAFKANSIISYRARRVKEDQTWLLE